jgi:hypothetical protein
MNKVQKVGLAVAAASGLVFAGGSLWGADPLDFPSLQVQVPDAVECWAVNPPVEGSPCYKETAGWWFGYAYAGGSITVKKQGSYVPFVEGVSLSDEADGSSLIDPDALRVSMVAVSENGTDYGGSGFGFNFGEPKSRRQDINSKGGYCITYESDGAVEFKLGHDESTYTDACTFEVSLPATTSGRRAAQIPWDNFDLPGWCKTNPPAGATVVSKTVALGEAEGLKIAIPATNATTPKTINFAIYQLGWLNDGCDTSPIISSGKISNGIQFQMVGNIVTLNVKNPTAVQVINLHGAVVHAQTLASPNDAMNLSKLPTGVYMLRVPSLGYVNRIIVK